jgi:hypothetical protein
VDLVVAQNTLQQRIQSLQRWIDMIRASQIGEGSMSAATTQTTNSCREMRATAHQHGSQRTGGIQAYAAKKTSLAPETVDRIMNCQAHIGSQIWGTEVRLLPCGPLAIRQMMEPCPMMDVLLHSGCAQALSLGL